MSDRSRRAIGRVIAGAGVMGGSSGLVWLLMLGVLAGFIIGLYVAIVVGIGTLIGDPSNLTLAIAATALVALVFEPVRARVQHWANVLVYGRRATPYEVLAGMSATTGTVEEQLSDSVRLLGEGTGADSVAIRNGAHLLAAWSANGEMLDHASQTWDFEVPMHLVDEQVGTVSIRKRRGDQVNTQDERLVNEFAGQTSLLVANGLLNQRLRQKAEELAESRRRLVSAQDEIRRRLERDLHDGAQQQLVALKVKLMMARRLAEGEDAKTVAATLEGIAADADSATETLRDLARGIYPPLLEAEGLVTAIEAQAGRSPVNVVVKAKDVVRYPRDVEAAVYFCVLEALGNSMKHGSPDLVTISIEDSGGEIRFSVMDDGPGFETRNTATGTGLQGMGDRVDTLGGSLEIRSSPGQGTTVNGVVPIPETAAV